LPDTTNKRVTGLTGRAHPDGVRLPLSLHHPLSKGPCNDA
jgi:hypothetical protein